MSGRAGRRGIDEKGNVVIYFKDISRMPDRKTLKNIVDHKVLLIFLIIYD